MFDKVETFKDFSNHELYQSCAISLYGRKYAKWKGEGWSITKAQADKAVRAMLRAHKGNIQSAIKECDDFTLNGYGVPG